MNLTARGLLAAAFCLLALSFPAARCQSRQPPSTAAKASPIPAASSSSAYRNKAYVVEQYRRVYNFHADGTWEETTTARIRVQSQAGVQIFGDLSLPYESDNLRATINYVRVVAPDGTVTATPDANVQDLPAAVTLSAPVYSDLRVKQIPVTDLNPGETLEYQFHTVEVHPEVPNQFWLALSFLGDGIVLDDEVQISVPEGKYVKVASTTVKPTVRTENGKKVYNWKTSRLVDDDSDTARKKKKKESEKPSIQITTFKNWQQLGEWYRNLAASRAAVTPAIRKKEQEITAGLTTDAAKQRAIYTYVSTRIRYIGLSFGIGRLQPHSAETVLQNKYGDCKDKHTLFAALMKAAGYDVWPALIGSGIKLDPDVPSLAQFNHLISVLPQGKKLIWLDTTEEVAPFGMLARVLRDKQALVMPAAGAPSLKKTPANPPFPEWYGFSMSAELSDKDTLSGEVNLKLRGDPELGFREAFRAMPREKWTDLTQAISGRLGFSGKVTHATATDPDKTETPFRVYYDYLEKDFSGDDKRWISPPLPPISFYYGENDTPPTEKISFGEPGVRDLRVAVRLPADETAKVPEDKDIKSDFAEYLETASFKDGILTAHRRYTVKKASIPASKWNDYLKFEQKVRARENKMIQIVHTKTKTSGKEKEVVEPIDNPKAIESLNRAYKAMDEGKLDLAEADLKQARNINPKQRTLWGAWARLELLRGNTVKALEFCGKEFTSHPEHYGKMTQQTVKASSELELGLALFGMKRYSEAVNFLEKAAKSDPAVLSPDKRQQARSELGRAKILLGDKAAGISDLEAALHSAKTPWQINGAAYYLAQSDVNLPEALTYAQKPVLLSEKDAAKINLAALTDQDLYGMVWMSNRWDTLGWVEFKLGRDAEAKKYLSAAWMLSQNGTNADHLGQIYQKEGKPKQAAHMYELALAAGLSEDATATSQRLKALKGPRSAMASKDSPKTGAELAKMRTFSVPAIIHSEDPLTASFFVLLSQSGVEDVRFTGGDKILSGAATQLKQVDFHPVFPDNGPEKIVREGVLFCAPYASSCTFTLLLARSAQISDAASSQKIDASKANP